MNYKRIIIGGLVGGLVINLLDLVVMFLFTGKIYEDLQAKGQFLREPALPFIPLWIAGIFLMGVLMAWFYAAVRPRLGAGPGTALLVSFILALMVHVPYNFASASWDRTGRLLPLIHMTAGILEFVIGGYIAAWIYREKEAAA